jgi:hypothetical protein
MTAADSIIAKIIDVIVAPLIQGLFILTILIFVWGVFGMIRNADDPTARKDGQSHMLWGVVGMFIMISAYGIVRLISQTVIGTNPF